MRRLLITTDAGGSDPDDLQSLIHLFQHLNQVDLRGIIVGAPNGNIDKVKPLFKAYRRDYNRFMLGKGFLSPEILEAITVKGVEYGDEKWKPNQGAAKIIYEARATPDGEFLCVCVWGAATDIATAIYLAPDIKPKLFIHLIGSWNTEKDKSSYDFLVKQKGLRIVIDHSSFRGIYLTGTGGGRFSNKGFVREFLEPRGELGQQFWRVSRFINVGSYGIKMGDTPSLLFFLSNKTLDPTKPSWGGRFKRVVGKRHWVDISSEKERLGQYNGARTVAVHRKAMLNSWVRQLRFIYGDI